MHTHNIFITGTKVLQSYSLLLTMHSDIVWYLTMTHKPDLMTQVEHGPQTEKHFLLGKNINLLIVESWVSNLDKPQSPHMQSLKYTVYVPYNVVRTKGDNAYKTANAMPEMI